MIESNDPAPIYDYGPTLFEESNDAIFVVDPGNLRIQDANPAAQRLTQWKKRYLLEATVDQLLKGLDRENTFSFLRACRETGFFHSQEEYTLRRAYGDELSVNVSVSRLHMAPEPLAIVVARDISQRKEAEQGLIVANAELNKLNEELRESRALLVKQERMKAFEKMADGIAHDLNNSLTPILTICELLVSQDIDREAVNEKLQLILTAARDAANMVRDLQLFHFAKRSTKRERVDLRDLVQQIPSLSQAQFVGSEIERISFKVRSDPVDPVWADSSELRRVLTNLTRNAIAAMPDGGLVDIRLFQEGSQVVMEVRDNGPGMSPEQLEKCLEPFFTTKSYGTGLGLTVSRQLIEAHGGKFSVASEAGQGTCIHVRLPTMTSQPDLPEQPAAKSPFPLPFMRVLLIDDNELSRTSARLLMEMWGLEVELASGARQGLTLCQDGSYDVVITDYSMPDLNGGELVRQLREVRPTMPIVVLSGWHENRIRMELSEAPQPDFILSKVNMTTELPEALASLDATRQRSINIGSEE